MIFWSHIWWWFRNTCHCWRPLATERNGVKRELLLWRVWDGHDWRKEKHRTSFWYVGPSRHYQTWQRVTDRSRSLLRSPNQNIFRQPFEVKKVARRLIESRHHPFTIVKTRGKLQLGVGGSERNWFEEEVYGEVHLVFNSLPHQRVETPSSSCQDESVLELWITK